MQRCENITTLVTHDSPKQADRFILSDVTVWRVDLQVDGDRRDAFAGSCESVCLCRDLSADLIEVCELLSFTVEKFTIF